MSVKVAALTKGVQKTMLITKLESLTAVLLVARIIAPGGGLPVHYTVAAQQDNAKQPVAHRTAVRPPDAPQRFVGEEMEQQAKDTPGKSSDAETVRKVLADAVAAMNKRDSAAFRA